MKILHIVAGDLLGGAARGAYWLHKALVELEIDSQILTNSKIDFEDNKVISIVKNKRQKILNFIKAKLDNNIQKVYKNRKKVIFSTGFFGFDFTKTDVYKQADIIHLHWINEGFVNIKDLNKVDKPIVWTIRDMWPMTGGCHYTMGCENFIHGCGKCEQLNSNTKFDLSRVILNRKVKYLSVNLKIIGISNWISKEAQRSFLFKNFDIRKISNNINSNDFSPINKQVAREILGIKTNKKIILVGAQNLNNFYKGFDKFLKAIQTLKKSKYFICFFGSLDKKVVRNLGFEHKSFGFLYDIFSLRLVYSASDVFVAPSLMDAFGKTLAEAMSCKIPVVCFNMTGPKDIVDHQKNGYLAKPFEPLDLANGIEWILNAPNYEELCKNAREKVLREFDSKIVAKKYIKLYKEILSEIN